MKVYVLASGSEGNSTYIETHNHKILLDAGRNTKYLTGKLEKIGVDINDIDLIFLSHAHKDHTESLPVLLKRTHPVVYITENMLDELESIRYYDNFAYLDDEVLKFDDFSVELINTSHDAVDSHGFIFNIEGKRVVQITDTGYLNMHYLDILRDADYYIFESNHDIEMIMNGPYPDYLKARIVGPSGHLSNKEASVYLAKIVGNNTKLVVLAHLSRHNNTEEIALNTVKTIFGEYGNHFDNFICANKDEITEVCHD